VARLEYVDWKSSGDTRFAPLASAKGEIECNGFWNHKPPRTDKDGVWIDSQTAIAPTLTERALEPGANVGRCRIIELQPNTYADCLYNLHQDDNNRLNPDGTGWVVRSFFNLTDDKDSYFVLRENRTDPSEETRIALPAGAQLVVDTQRLWHAAAHHGDEPRYCLITSWESGPELDAYIAKYNGVNKVESLPVDQETLDAGQAEQAVASPHAPRRSLLAASRRSRDERGLSLFPPHEAGPGHSAGTRSRSQRVGGQREPSLAVAVHDAVQHPGHARDEPAISAPNTHGSTIGLSPDVPALSSTYPLAIWRFRRRGRSPAAACRILRRGPSALGERPSIPSRGRRDPRQEPAPVDSFWVPSASESAPVDRLPAPTARLWAPELSDRAPVDSDCVPDASDRPPSRGRSCRWRGRRRPS
jgi:hypothetical protein